MSKGMFTQCVVVLLRRAVTLADLRSLLEHRFEVLKEVPIHERWEYSGPSLVLGYRLEVNGLVSVDVVDRPWPDGMGAPKEEPWLFGAWTFGNFGPLTFPGNLQRAVEHAWSWPEAREVAPAHKSFVRVKLSYVFGAEKDAPVWPEDCDPEDELSFVTGVARALLDHPEALCLFNPGGELLLGAPELDDRIQTDQRLGVPAIDAWTNVRVFRRDDGWSVMDTVGNGQLQLLDLDTPDLEAAYPTERFSVPEVEAFLRNTTLYLLRHPGAVKNGDTIDGPGGLRWQGWTLKGAFFPPPRRVMRWVPIRPDEEWESAPLPLDLVPEELRSSRAAGENGKPWWKRWFGGREQ